MNPLIITKLTKEEHEFFSAAAKLSVSLIKARFSTLSSALQYANKEILLYSSISPPSFEKLVKTSISYFSQTQITSVALLKNVFIIGSLSAYEELMAKRIDTKKVLFTQKIYPFKSTDDFDELEDALTEAAILIFKEELSWDLERRQKAGKNGAIEEYYHLRKLKLITTRLPELDGMF